MGMNTENNTTVTNEQVHEFMVQYGDITLHPKNYVVRIVRDKLLTETDVWGLADYPVTAEQTAYRQALRDITGQAGFPTDITWPTKP